MAEEVAEAAVVATAVADPHTVAVEEVVVVDTAAVATHHEEAGTVADTAREEAPATARTRSLMQHMCEG